MRRLIPQGLTGQLLAVLLLALLAGQALSLVIFADERRIALRAANREQVLARLLDLNRARAAEEALRIGLVEEIAESCDTLSATIAAILLTWPVWSLIGDAATSTHLVEPSRLISGSMTR